MRVQLGVTEAARAMPELGGDEPRRWHPSSAPLLELGGLCCFVVRPAPHEARLTLQPAERFGHGEIGGCDHLGSHQRVTQRVEH